MLAIKNNLMAAGAARNLGASYDNLAVSVARLSSGLRINSAKDDAAGLAVRELLRADIAALNQGARNANDGVSMLQTAEGALGQVDGILIRMRELCEQANTDTYSATQKGIMQSEYDELALEIDRIVTGTDFNSNNLLNSPGSTFNISLGGGSTTAVSVDGKDMKATGLLALSGTFETATGPTVDAAGTAYLTGDAGTDTLDFGIGGENLVITVGAGSLTLTETAAAINVVSRGVQAGWEAATVEGSDEKGYQLVVRHHTTGAVADITVVNVGATEWAAGVVGIGGAAVAAGATDFNNVDGSGVAVDITQAGAIATIDAAIDTKDAYRAELGYKMNRLEAAAAVLSVQAENLAAAESRISDVDVATEMSAMTRNQVLSQAGIAMLGQANSMPQMALSLLQG